MITIKSAEEIGKMRRAGALLHQVLEELRKLVEPGVTTAYIDEVAEKLIRDGGAIPSSKGYEGFPSSICASVNDEVVHGFPSKRVLKEGDLLSIDCTLLLDGWQSDSAFSVAVGKASPETERLIRVTEECFWIGLDKARAGNRIGDIGHAVQEHAEKNGYGVIRDLCGHGIGREMHEEPDVPNYGMPGRGPRLKRGMTICIEPMISAGHYSVHTRANGWDVVTDDGSICSHYEHTVLITDDKPEILTLGGVSCK